MNSEGSGTMMRTAPSEISGPPPRKTRLKQDESDGRFLLAAVLFFLVGGGAFLAWKGYYDINQWYQRSALRSDGHEVLGEVTGFAYSRYAPLDIYYVFTVNGRTYSGEALQPSTPVPASSFNKGDAIPVRFLPSNPQINHPASWEWSATIGWYTILAAIGAVVIGVVALFGLLRDRELARYGKAAEGVVSSCVRNGRTFKVEYEFRTEDGNSVEGKSSGPEEYGEGARIWILYLPRNPRRNRRYPLDYFEITE